MQDVTPLPRLQSVAESAKWIQSQATHVQVGGGLDRALDKLCTILDRGAKGPTLLSGWKEGHALTPKVADISALAWIWLVDCLNFSFWPEERGAPPFAVDYGGVTYTGYWSMVACVNRAFDEGIPITTPEYQASLTLDQCRHIFRSSSDQTQPIPLLAERCQVLNEAGSMLLKRFGGKVDQMISEADQSASLLLHLLTSTFPSFSDTSDYHGHRVYFHKRAQIFIADVYACFEGHEWGAFSDINSITMFADYRVPQALLFLDVLEYSPTLIDHLKRADPKTGNRGVLEHGDEREVEIRGLSIYVVDLMVERLRQRGLHHVNAILLDFYLWDMAKELGSDLDGYPIHRTRSIYY